MSDREIREVEDYTTTCLVLFCANLFWMLFVLWATLGMPVVLVVAAALDWLIRWIGMRRSAR